ncbi:hypothetical protein ACIQ9E_09530 [Streptomyces sp. NPDC094448]|uniref:hypothetical protein n=1 Tax=Streptomyces sp. NPDC094448 TaxID=3366063 RepID=UPI003829F25B
MQTAIVRRGAVAASAVSLALLLAACGGDDSNKDTKGEKGGKEEVKQSAPAKSQAELEKLMFAKTDLKGYEVDTPTPAELKDAKAATADKKECATLNEALAVGAPGPEVAFAARQVAHSPGTPEKATGTIDEKTEAAIQAINNVTVNQLSLGSYPDGEAAGKAMAELKKSAESCASGFTSTVAADKTKYTKVAPGSYTGGDEALAYTVTMELDGEPMKSRLVVVRKGTEILNSHSLTFSGEPAPSKDVIDAQLKKLG